MPKCRNCGTRLTKFETDRCPVCGTVHPLEGVNSDTVDVTDFYKDFKFEKKDKDKKAKIITSILALFFGFLGVPFFYLRKTLEGFVTLIISILVFASLFLSLYCSSIDLMIVIIICSSSLLVINASLLIFAVTRKEIKRVDKIKKE